MNSFLDRVVHRARGEAAPSVHPRRLSAFEPAAGEGPGVWEGELQSTLGQGGPGDAANGIRSNDSRQILSGDPYRREDRPGQPGAGDESSRRPDFPELRAILDRGIPDAFLGPPPGPHHSPGASGGSGREASSPAPGRKASLCPSESGDGGGGPFEDAPPTFPGAGSGGEDAPDGVVQGSRRGRWSAAGESPSPTAEESAWPAGMRRRADGSGSIIPRSEGASGGLRSLRVRPSHTVAIQGPGTASPGLQGRSDDARDFRGSPGRNGDTRGDRSAGAVGHEPPAPVVHVTIGRIEIRAPAQPTPSAQPPRPVPVSEPAAGPRLGLEDYLQQRIRGER